jgi:hypothetical protein
MLARAIEFAKIIITNNKEFFLKLFLIGFIIDILPLILIDSINGDLLMVSLIVSTVLNILFFIFMMKMGINFYDLGESKLSNFFKIDVILYTKLLIGSVLGVVITLLPVVFLIIPIVGWILTVVLMILFCIRLLFVNYLIIDDNLGPLEAVYKSMEIVDGYWWKTFGIFIVFSFCGMIINLIKDGIKYLLEIDTNTTYSLIEKLLNPQLLLSDVETWNYSTTLLSKGIDSVFSLVIEIVGALLVVYIYKTIKGESHNPIVWEGSAKKEIM